MRKAIALCCLLLLLAGCTGAPKNADADPTPAPPASDTPTASAAASSPQPVRELYRITVGTENIPIYDGPGYQCTLVDRISTPGVYTIVEETRDAEGNLWGKLKSGIGWIHVAYMNTDVAGVAPIVLDYADEDLIAGGHFYACGNSGAEYVIPAVIHGKLHLNNILLCEMVMDEWGGLTPGQTVGSWQELPVDIPIVAYLEFPGDFTTYGLSFTDDYGNSYAYIFYLSGMDGSLVLDLYRP